MTTIGIIPGSLRQQSFSKQISLALMDLLPENMQAEIIDLSPLAMFNQDYDDNGTTPEAWTNFRQKVKNTDGFLFVTPEYNRSLPPVLKNAIDIASRPYGENVWAGKPAAIVGQSPGKMGGMGAAYHLRHPLSFLNMHLLPNEILLSDVYTLLDADGALIDGETKEFLQGFIADFADFVQRFR